LTPFITIDNDVDIYKTSCVALHFDVLFLRSFRMNVSRVFSFFCSAVFSSVLLAPLAFFALVLPCSSANAQSRAPTTFYVSPNGSGTDGLTEQTAFRKINDLYALTIPGDTVLVMNGTYTEPNFRSPIAYIDKSGRPDAYITYKNYPGHRPKIKSRNITAIRLVGASYVVIEGFDVEGSRNEVSFEEADRLLCDEPDSSERVNIAQGNGIDIVAEYSDVNKISHHIIIRNNRVSNFGSSGIGAQRADYLTIENNTVFDTALYSPYDTSGISLYQLRDLESIPAADAGKILKNIIRGNISYANKNLFGFAKGFDGKKCDRSAPITDGNGIIIDDFLNTQNKVPALDKRPYRGRTLVENNIVYGNGGRGINIYSTNHVDVVNNTSYKNGLTGTDFSEVSSVDTADVRYLNNIIYALPDRKINSIGGALSDAKTVRYDNNLIFGGSGFDPVSGGNNLVGQEPKFVNVAANDFALSEGSPAIDRGLASLNGLQAPKVDQRGTTRPQRSGIDIGAIELADSVSQALADGTYTFTNSCNGQVLGLQNGAPSPGDNVVVRDAGTRGAITWQVNAVGDGTSRGAYTLRVPGTTSVLQSSYARVDIETNVDVWSDFNGDSQRWIITDTGGGAYKLVLAAAPNMVLDLKYSGKDGESNVWLYSDNGTCAQRWRLKAS
jgi:Ricin-type beta-trefoil lectin domain-like/Right handed beta helix region